MSNILPAIQAFALSLALFSTACVAHPAPALGEDQPTVNKEVSVKPYPLDHCVVSGEKFGGDMGEAITKVYQGQEIKFCCKDCVKEFDRNPDKVLAKVQAEAVKTSPSPAVPGAAPDKNVPAPVSDPTKPHVH